MKGPYCRDEMQSFTESFVCCFNDNCSHRDLPANQRKGGKTRGYSCEGSPLTSKEKKNV